MSSDRATTTFPLETMTEAQRQTFTQFLEARKSDQINIREPIWLALVLVREKPATGLTALTSPSAPLTVEDVVKAFDLNYRWWYDTHMDVARTSWWLDLRPTQGEVSDAYHRRLGCFFGYPIEDVEYYLNSDDNSRTMPADLVAEGLFEPKEIAYTTFVPHGQDDSIEGYERAIRSGKRVRTTIDDYADSWNIPELMTYADQLYQDAIAECSPFAFG